MAALDNYYRLLARVDELCRTIGQSLGEAITCHAGCSSCCLSISVFPVEMAAMIEAAGQLPADELLRLKEQLAAWNGGECCPLLRQERCLLYEARPIICRTHGLPILMTEGDERRVDVCPLNCRGLDHLPGEAVLDLERLNTLLVSVNVLYLKEFGLKLPDRIPLADLAEMLP